MKIHQFSRILAFPFALWFAIVLFISMKNVDYDLSYWVIPPFVIMAMIWVMAPQVDYWWLKRFPVPLEKELTTWLINNSPFYRTLSDSQRQKYDIRLMLFLNAKAFSAMGHEKQDMPEDMKVAVAHNAIEMTLGKDEFLFKEMEQFIIYKHPFPSPRYQFLHTVETHNEDGVMILSLEHLFAATSKPNALYHIGKHAFAEAFVKQNPKITWVGIERFAWEDIEKVNGFTSEQILATIGFKVTDLVTVTIATYFTFPDRFKHLYPKEAKYLDEVFER